MTYKGYTDPRYVTTAEDLHGRLNDVVLIDVRASFQSSFHSTFDLGQGSSAPRRL